MANDIIAAVKTSTAVINKLHENNGSSPTELSKSLDVSVSTVHRHLNTLHEAGYVLKEDNKYYLGFRFLNLGEYTRYRKQEYQTIAEKLGKIAKKTGLETDFSVFDHGRLIVVHQVHQEENYWNNRSTGNYYYAHSTSAGKALLAEFTEKEVNDVVSQWGLPAQTKNTITTFTELHSELEQTRQRGYGINDEESAEGLRSVGMTIETANDSIIGCVSISGPAYRIRDSHLHERFPEILRNAVQELKNEF